MNYCCSLGILWNALIYQKHELQLSLASFSHFWTKYFIQSELPGLNEKRLFLSDDSTFYILFGHQGPRFWKKKKITWRGTDFKLLDVLCEVSAVSKNFGGYEIYCFYSPVFFYQFQIQHLMLPSAKHFWEMPTLFSRGTLHLPTLAEVQIPASVTRLDWLDRNPTLT